MALVIARSPEAGRNGATPGKFLGERSMNKLLVTLRFECMGES